jgi:hypothetical protein
METVVEPAGKFLLGQSAAWRDLEIHSQNRLAAARDFVDSFLGAKLSRAERHLHRLHKIATLETRAVSP